MFPDEFPTITGPSDTDLAMAAHLDAMDAHARAVLAALRDTPASPYLIGAVRALLAALTSLRVALLLRDGYDEYLPSD
jgi:hypothetical protein